MYNPGKHGLVQRVKDRPFSTFHRYFKDDVYPENWGVIAEATRDEDYGE